MTSFAEIYGAYAKDLFNFALHLTRDRADAEDLTAETFARLWTARNVKLATVKGYLFAIARNLHIEQHRKHRPTTQVPEVADDSTSPEAMVVSRDQATRLWKILDAMPEVDRSALLMRGEGLPYEEIARILGITLSNAKVKVHRARIRAAMLLREADHANRP